MTSDIHYHVVATYAVPGVEWGYQCKACANGSVQFRACYFDCEKCGAKNVVTHQCPKDHNHPMPEGGFEGISLHGDANGWQLPVAYFVDLNEESNA